MQVARYLEHALSPDISWWHTPNGGKRSKAEAGRFKAMGVKAGIPDLLFFHRSQLDAIELKVGKNNLTSKQEDVRDQLLREGARYAVCRSLSDVCDTLDEWGYRLKARPV